jgi:hypothetical protein
VTRARSSRGSSFGMDCVQCGKELIAPQWTEYRNERQVHHVWHCWNCDCQFEAIVSLPADDKSMKDIMTRADIFPSLLVA